MLLTTHHKLKYICTFKDDPDSGKITIDGMDLREYDLKTLHKNIGVVAQSPGLFQRSIADNIAYGVRDQVSKQDVEKAADVANCGFVKDFRACFDTFAGSGGTQISGGQKQRECKAYVNALCKWCSFHLHLCFVFTPLTRMQALRLRVQRSGNLQSLF